MSVTSDEENLDCPLCMEEIDITDRYFKPCPCGYQICRFCWNHIKENLNGLCPACRRTYSDDTVEYRTVPPEEISRIKAAKKKKERERKEQDQLSRRHLANVRIVQKNLVYVLGLPPKVATDEMLRTQDYFGQYGKITRVVVNRRAHSHTPVLAQVPNTGVYITFTRKEEAARAIEAVDGSIYDGKIIRATYGTTKYCASFLKNQPCQNPVCQFLHEPGEEADSFAKDELSRMQLRERNPKPPPFPSMSGKKEEKEESALPATASWAKPVARPQNTHYSAASVSSVSSTASGMSGSPEAEEEPYDSNMSMLRPKDLTRPAQISTTVADRKKGKARVTSAELPPGLSTPNPFDVSEIGDTEVEQVMGSSALDESNEQAEINVAKGSSPPSLRGSSEESVVPAAVNDDSDHSLSPSSLGFILHPRYIGPFDPFRADPIPPPAALLSADIDSQTRSTSRASDGGQRSRFERFFGNGQALESESAFDSAGLQEKGKEDVKSVQESFRAMFPNVNVSFASGSLTDAEARWGESFSPSKLALQGAQGGDSWGQSQGFPLRSQQLQQQQPQLAFQSGARGLGNQFSNANTLALQQQREQQLLQQQQQYLSSLPHNQQVQPHIMNQLQQLRLAQMQQQQQQQQQQHFSGLPHNMHPPQQQDELLTQLLRDAQLRESHLRQDQIRELQLRANANAAQGRAGFEGRGRPRNYDSAPSQAHGLDYQQDWPSSTSATSLGPGYGANVRFGEWGGSVSASKGHDAGGSDSPIPSGTRSPAGASTRAPTRTGSSGSSSRASSRNDGEGRRTSGNDPRRNTPELHIGESALGMLSGEGRESYEGDALKGGQQKATGERGRKKTLIPLELVGDTESVDTKSGADGDMKIIWPKRDTSGTVVESSHSSKSLGILAEQVASLGSDAKTISSRPQTPTVSATTSNIGSPTPRRVLSITPAKKPVMPIVQTPEPDVPSILATVVETPTSKRRGKGSMVNAPVVLPKEKKGRSSMKGSEQETNSSATEQEPVGSVAGRVSKAKARKAAKVTEEIVSTTPVSQEIASSEVKPASAEVEVEAILSQKPKKRKVKKIPVKKPIVSQVTDAEVVVTMDEKENKPNVDGTSMGLKNVERNTQPITHAESTSVTIPKPTKPARQVERNRQAHVPIPPPRTDSNRGKRNYRGTDPEIDLTPFITVQNSDNGGFDVQIDPGAMASAMSQFREHYRGGKHQGQKPVIQQTSGPDGSTETTATFDLSTLGFDVGQLDQLTGKLGNFGGIITPAEASSSEADSHDHMTFKINGMPVKIAKSVFIDQVLENLATTAARLYEGLEAQVEKVRQNEESKNKGKATSVDEMEPSDEGIQRVAEQVTRLEQYAARLQERVVREGTPTALEDMDSDLDMAPPVRKARKTLSSAEPLTSPISEMFGVGLNPATADWTMDDWRAKCRSVEVVMKRVREARDLRRKQRGEPELDIDDGLSDVTASRSTDQAALTMFEALTRVAAQYGQDQPDSCGQGGVEFESGNAGDDEQSMSSSGFVTPNAMDSMAASSSPCDNTLSHIVENNDIQHLLETVRLLVSNGESLANAPSSSASPHMDLTSNGTAAGGASSSGNGKKKKKKNANSSTAASPAVAQLAQPEALPPYYHSDDFNLGMLFDEQGRPTLGRDLVAGGQMQPLSAEFANVISGACTADIDSMMAYENSDDLAPIVFDPAPLLAAVANGSIIADLPIPWEIFGLRGPPPSWQQPPPAPPLVEEVGAVHHSSCHHAHSPYPPPPSAHSAPPTSFPSPPSRNTSLLDIPVSMDVQILERELEASRSEELELEKQLVQVVRRNRVWQRQVADALDWEIHMVDAGQPYDDHLEAHPEDDDDDDLYVEHATGESTVDHEQEQYEDAVEYEGSDREEDDDLSSHASR